MAVNKLGELRSEGQTFLGFSWEYPESIEPGETGGKVKHLQYMLSVLSLIHISTVTSSFLFNIAVSSHPMGLIDTMSVSDKLYVCQTNVIRDLARCV